MPFITVVPDPTAWGQWVYRVDVYLRIRRTVMVEGMSIREAARTFGQDRDTVRKMLAYSGPPGYVMLSPPRRPKLDTYTAPSSTGLSNDFLDGHVSAISFLGGEPQSILYDNTRYD